MASRYSPGTSAWGDHPNGVGDYLNHRPSMKNRHRGIRLVLLGLIAIGAAGASEATVPMLEIGGLSSAIEADFLREQAARPLPEPKGYWVTVRATAYSPHDALDGDYHHSKGDRWRWITADGRTDVRSVPYGIAVPLLCGGRPIWPYATRVLIPAGQGYLDLSGGPADRTFAVDDCGSAIRRRSIATGILHIDLRFRHESSALAFGGSDGWRELRVFVFDPPPVSR